MSGTIDTDRLRRLQLITEAALAHLGLDDLLRVLLDRIRDTLEVDTCAVLLLDGESNEFVARAAVGLEEEVERGVRIPVGRGFAGRVVAGRRPVLLDDVDHADVLNPLLREKGIKTLLGVPLVVEGDAIGVLHIGTLTPRAFDRSEVELLQLVGDRAALAIDHARLFEAERAARRRLEQVQAVTDAALAHLDLDELLGELLTRIRDILEADTCAFLLLDDDGRELVARAAVGLEEEVERGVRIPVGQGFAGRVAAERRPVVLDDVDHADVLNPLLREKGIKSLLGAPLLVHGEPIGVVHVGTLVPRVFTPSDVELLELVAERAALGIEKARVHEKTVRLDELRLNFVAIASHELRTPATAVYGIAATLRERGDALSPESREQLGEMLWEQADRLRRLIEQLLDLSRLDARGLRVEAERIAVRRAVAEAVASVVGPSADVVVEVDDELEAVVDPLMLERVVVNLVANALDHGSPPVVVSTDGEDGLLRVVVQDHGPGVPPEVVPSLFQRFGRGLDSGGRGLGLSIAKAYATAHGGDLVYEADTRGARFVLVLPAG